MTPAILLSVLTAGTVSVSSSSPFVVAKQGSEAVLEVTVLDAQKNPADDVPTLSAFGVGSLGSVEKVGPGKFRATYQPPKERYPQLAIILAEAKPDGSPVRSWFVLPVHGQDTLKLSTKPNAQVEVLVAGRSFGGLVADAQGKVEVPVEVPPGVDTGTVKSIDKLGNRRQKPVSLDPVEFSRVRVWPHGEPKASWADAQGLAVEVFAVGRDGKTPLPKPPALKVEPPEAGTLSSPVAVRPGVFTYTFRAGTKVGEGKALLQASLAPTERPIATHPLEVQLRPGPPVSVKLDVSEDRWVAGARKPLLVTAEVADQHQNPVPVHPGAQLELPPDSPAPTQVATGWNVILPDAFKGETQAALVVSSGGQKARKSVELVPGPPAKGTVTVSKRVFRAGGQGSPVTLVVTDAFGNPVRGEKLKVESGVGLAEQVKELGDGTYTFTLSADERAAGTSEFKVVTSGDYQPTERYTVLKSIRQPGFHGGLLGVFHSTSTMGGLKSPNPGGPATGTAGLSPALELGYRLPSLALEVFAQAGVSSYRDVSGWLTSEAPAGAAAPDPVAVTVKLDVWSAHAGARYDLPLTDRVWAHGALGVGVTQVASTFRFLVDVPVPEYKTSVTTFSMLGAAGVTYELGPGRVLAELQLRYAPVNRGVEGNLGGLGLGVGYLVNLL